MTLWTSESIYCQINPSEVEQQGVVVSQPDECGLRSQPGSVAFKAYSGRRAEQLYQQLDALVRIRRETRGELLAESRKHPAHQLLL